MYQRCKAVAYAVTELAEVVEATIKKSGTTSPSSSREGEGKLFKKLTNEIDNILTLKELDASTFTFENTFKDEIYNHFRNQISAYDGADLCSHEQR